MHAQNLLEEGIDRDDLELELPRAGEGQDLADDAVGLLDLRLDDSQVLDDLWIDRRPSPAAGADAELRLDEIRRVIDDRQGIADLVADHGGHLADRRQALLLD